MVDVVFSLDWRPKIGGAHFWLEAVYGRWPSEVRILTCRAASDSDDNVGSKSATTSVVRRGAAMENLGLTPGTLRSAVRNAVELHRLAGRGPWRLHCKGAFPEGLVGCLARPVRRKANTIVVYAHGEEILVARSSRFLTLVARHVYKRADLVIANSESTRFLVDEFAPGTRVQVIHPGVDTAMFRIARPREETRLALGIEHDEVMVLSVGRLEPRKNQRRVIEAVAALREKGYKLRYVCAGDGGERASLENAIRHLNGASWALLLGAAPDELKRDLFVAADIFAMPSVRHGEMIEGFGIVFLEAAAAGIPSIAGRVGGQAEAVQDCRTGLVVDGDDTEAIAGALGMLASNQALRSEMGRAGIQWALENDWAEVVRKTYDAVCSAQ